MSDQVYKLYGSVTASTDGVANLDFQFNGVIEGILLNINVTGADALNDGGGVEISFASTSGLASNDTRASIAGLKVNQGFLTSGGGPVGDSVFVSLGKGIPVAAGERIYMHLQVSGTVTAVNSSCWLYTAVTDAGRIARRRL